MTVGPVGRALGVTEQPNPPQTGPRHARDSRQADRAWWRDLVWTSLVIWALRVGVGIAAEKFTMLALPSGSSLTGGLANQYTVDATKGGGLAHGLLHWDAVYYLAIAHFGYPGGSGHLSPEAAFFPLYPLLISVVGHVVPFATHPYEVAALAVSWASLLVAIAGVMAIVREWTGSTDYADAAIAFAWFPASVFLIAGYPESLFVALVAWTLYFVTRERYLVAAVLAGVCSASRMEGALLIVVILWPVVTRRIPPLRGMALAVVAELGLLGYAAFCWVNYGSPIAFLHAEKYWNRRLTWPLHPVEAFLVSWAHGQQTIGSQTAVLALDSVLGLGAVAATIGFVWWAWGRRELLGGAAILTVLLTVLAISSGPSGRSPEAMGRFVMCIVPLYALVPVLLPRIPGGRSLLAASAGVALVAQTLFTLGYWFT